MCLIEFSLKKKEINQLYFYYLSNFNLKKSFMKKIRGVKNSIQSLKHLFRQVFAETYKPTNNKPKGSFISSLQKKRNPPFTHFFASYLIIKKPN